MAQKNESPLKLDFEQQGHMHGDGCTTYSVKLSRACTLQELIDYILTQRCSWGYLRIKGNLFSCFEYRYGLIIGTSITKADLRRINSAIPVQNLTDEHLLAEHREIKRLPDNFLKALKSGALRRIPKEFCLGTGHVTFFLDKQMFLLKRYYQIHTECLKRGFNVEDYSDNWLGLEDWMQGRGCWYDYVPTETEKHLLRTRICERITASRKERFHYYGKPISKKVACALTCAANIGISHKEEFNKWAKESNLCLLNSSAHIESAKDLNLAIGDKILFKNDYGIIFGPHEVLGFCYPEQNGRCIYFDNDAYWCPAKISQIIKL